MRDTVTFLTNDEKVVVNNFMVKFIRANIDSDVIFVKARREKDYIRVDVLINGRAEWFHVINADTWY